jgi:Tfp pilus assembly protein PilN
MSPFVMAGLACVVVSAIGTGARVPGLRVPILSQPMVRVALGLAGVLLVLAAEVLREPSESSAARGDRLRSELLAVEAQSRELERLEQTQTQLLTRLEAMTAARRHDLGRAAPEEREHIEAELQEGNDTISEARAAHEQLGQLLVEARVRSEELRARLDGQASEAH